MIDAERFVELSLKAGFSRDQVKAAMRTMSDQDVLAMAHIIQWGAMRHEYQVVPAGNWSTWLVLAGRGTGKTRLGSEFSFARCVAAPAGSGYRHLVAAPTNGDIRSVCFEGDSGLLAVIPPALIQSHNKTNQEIILHNGALIAGIAAEQARRFRGPQWHSAWADELAAWGDNGKDPQYAWDMMTFSVRLGNDTRKIATTTPKPIPLIRGLVKDPNVIVTTASTYVNIDNLSPDFAKEIMKYEGTKIGRQEIHAEVLDSEEDGIVKRKDLRLWPAGKAFPAFDYIVMSLDTSFSEESYDPKKRESDPSACSVWGGFRLDGKPGIMLLDCWQEKLGFPALVAKVKKERENRYGEDDRKPLIRPAKGPPATIDVGKGIDLTVIEDKASGPSLRQQLAHDGIPCFPYNPGKSDKLTRLHIVSPLPANGMIWIPESLKNPGKFMSWAEPLIEQLCGYSGEGTLLHDDLLDTTTQAWRLIDHQWLHYLPKKGMKVEQPPPPKRVNHYAQ